MTLVDSSVLIGWMYADDALHGACVDAVDGEVSRRRGLAISVVTWAEVLTGAGADRRARAAADDFLVVGKVAMVPVDRAVAERAAELRRRSTGRGGRVPMADAMILATGAVRREIDRVLTADARWRRLRTADVRVETIGAR